MSNTLHNAIMESGSKDRPPMLAPGNYNPPYELGWKDKEVPTSEGNLITTTERVHETYKNVSQEIRDALNAEADGETLESYYSRFYKMMNELIRNRCKVTNYQVNVQFLLQLQPEWHRNRGKTIINSPQPIYDQEPSMVAEDDEMSKDKEIDKLMALISLSFKKIYKPTNNNLQTSSNTSRANQDNSLRIHRNAGYENQRIGNVVGAKESVEANNRLSETNNLLYADYKKSEAELARRNSKEYASQMEIECAKKEAQIKLYKTREDKELDKVIELEQKVKVLDNIVYKTGQSVQTMNMLNNKCRTSFAKPEFLKKAQRANPRLYDIDCYNDNLALMLALDSDEVIRLEKESRSKLSELIRPFDYDKLNNLYDLFVPQREKSSEQHYFSERSRLSHINVNNRKSKEAFNKQTTLLEKRMDESIPLDKKFQSSIEIFKVKSYVNTIITGVELCKQKIANRIYICYIDPFIQNTIESNFSPVINRINAGLDQFHRCLNKEMVADLRYFNSLELEVDSLRSQLETQKT
nr:hypothetical protein [Tanacetum cinerariifolium]